MRTYQLKIGKRTVECATTFKANMMITERVMDPMIIAREEALFAQAQAAGRNYEGAYKMTTMNLVKIIHAGQEAAGGKLDLDEIGDMVMEAGPVNVLQETGNYLAALVAGESVELTPAKKGAKKKGASSGNG